MRTKPRKPEDPRIKMMRDAIEEAHAILCDALDALYTLQQEQQADVLPKQPAKSKKRGAK